MGGWASEETKKMAAAYAMAGNQRRSRPAGEGDGGETCGDAGTGNVKRRAPRGTRGIAGGF